MSVARVQRIGEIAGRGQVAVVAWPQLRLIPTPFRVANGRTGQSLTCTGIEREAIDRASWLGRDVGLLFLSSDDVRDGDELQIGAQGQSEARKEQKK